jgi:hypothetical protein
MVNFPIQLVPAMHRALQQDIAWASDAANTTAEDAKNFAVDDILIITTCHLDKSTLAGGGGEGGGASSHVHEGHLKKKKKKKGKGKRKRQRLEEEGGAGGGGGGAPAKFFEKFEDELYLKQATWHTIFDLPKPKRGELKASEGGTLQNDGYSHLQEKGLAMVVPHAAWDSIVRGIEKLVADSL